jgi:glycerol-3-phosphate dehydrogenase (NAD(P)+)
MTVVLGAGAFGTALALALAAKGPVTLWGRDIGWAATRENPRLPGVTLPDAVSLTDTLPDMPGPVLLALPMQALGGFLRAHSAALEGRALVLCCKGIDLETLRGPSALMARPARPQPLRC